MTRSSLGVARNVEAKLQKDKEAIARSTELHVRLRRLALCWGVVVLSYGDGPYLYCAVAWRPCAC